MKYKKSLFVTVVIVLFFVFFKFSENIDVKRDAIVMDSENSSFFSKTKIHIKGDLKYSLFGKSTFKGNILIDSYNESKTNQTELIITKEKDGVRMASLMYLSPKKPFSIVSSNVIWFDKKFHKINVWINDEDESSNYFVVTGSSEEEALSIQNELRTRFGEKLFMPK
ncbi:hypothetical protein ACTHPH_16545 [Paenibacillus pasadenensis]|uniref:hypothetical protein n=1 Tax=Paenibacillus TaxID=44249 RepID=UPI000411253A|nr:hypothetical protein [Paenibacillus pasadenensis]